MEKDLERDLKGELEGDPKGTSNVQVRSGLVQVLFSLQPKFNSFELDSEVDLLIPADGQIKENHISSFICPSAGINKSVKDKI